ncbi:MAG: translation factor GTPase family protein [Bacteroidota bacterium]
MNKKIRNIALFAHVDAGKTTVSEHFLHLSGKIKSPGSVDKGNSQTDFLEVEKERGITVNSTVLTFGWNNTYVNLIDTPGHIDFSSETEKAILAIDSAVIIVSALEGVQAQTENIVNLLLKHNKPFIIFVNKIDRIGANTEHVLEEIHKELELNTFELQQVINEGSDNADIKILWDSENYKNSSSLIEKIVEQDEALFEQYVEGEDPDFQSLDLALIEGVRKQSIIPIAYGSAKFALGIDYLLDYIVHYLPDPPQFPDELFGVVFKIYHIKGIGKLSAVRLFGGDIKSRTNIKNASKNIEEKVSIIKNTDIQNQEVIQSISAGEIAWIQGLKESEPGDYIGHLPDEEKGKKSNKALLTVQIFPKNPSDINALIEAMYILNNEDPDLRFNYSKEEQELHINIRGEIQKEVLQSVLRLRFNLEIEFTEPTVIYKETPTVACEGYVRYWLPKPCWAIMKFKIEPGERGSGVIYSSQVGVNQIKKQYQNDVEKAIPFSLQQGVLGWQVDDIKITLIDGEDHEAHTKSNDFTIATPMGIMEGLTHSKSTLLEPILSFKLIAPEEFLGSIISELLKLRAEFSNPEIDKEQCKIKGEIPLATSINFPIKLSSLTSGKGKIITHFSSYKACDISLGITREYKGISPLDTSKYILKARKALV